MNAPVALHCGGCGRELGLEPIPEPAPFDCPGCSRQLTSFAGERGRLYDCAACGGQFVEQALLRELLEQREICGAAVPKRPLARDAALAPVRYAPCPACGALMNRANFGGMSGVIVDVCARHGVWFDAGELPRVLAFVEDGGLVRARRLRLEELERRERELRLSTIELSSHAAAEAGNAPRTNLSSLGDMTGSLRYPSDPAWSTGLWDDAKEAAHELLELIGGEIARFRGSR